MTFRTDINGLRAIAVIFVMLFHFDETLAPGGFVGVDVFFVISGFLMTKIIITAMQNDTFSFRNFYAARAKRIIPPLAFLCLSVLIFGWFFLSPMDYRQLGNDALNSILFISNFIYAKEQGYFDSAPTEQWLLHTWSLSAEWQFYIIYPLIILTLKKYLSLQKVKITLLVMTAISFIFCVFYTYQSPTESYFLLPSRAWEMLLGGIVFLYPLPVKAYAKQIQRVSLLVLFISFFYINDTHAWPSFYTLLPVFATYLILLTNNKNTILDSAVLQALGKWSYSIYLWHWFIVIIGSYFQFENWIYFGFPLSIALGFLSFYFIESKKRKSALKPIFYTMLITLLGASIHKTDGVLAHYSDEIQLIYNESQFTLPTCEKKETLGCKFINNKSTPNDGYADYILLGDSHSGPQLTTILQALPKGKSLIYITSSGCLFIPNLASKQRTLTGCNKAIDIAYNKILESNKGSTLIFVQRTNIYFQGYNQHESEDKDKDIRHIVSPVAGIESAAALYADTLCSLVESHQVVVTKPTPEQLVNVPNDQIKSLLLNKNNDVSLSLQDYRQRNSANTALFTQLKACAINVLDPVPYLCNQTHCPASNNGKPIYRDDDHLSSFGTLLLLPMYENAFINTH